MRPSARISKFLENCDSSMKLADARALLETVVAAAENDTLLRAAIELENNYFPKFSQADAAHTVMKLKR